MNYDVHHLFPSSTSPNLPTHVCVPVLCPPLFLTLTPFSECCPYVHTFRALCWNMNNPPAAKLPKKNDSPSGPQ